MTPDTNPRATPSDQLSENVDRCDNGHLFNTFVNRSCPHCRTIGGDGA